jgi:hypothetical protein
MTMRASDPHEFGAADAAFAAPSVTALNRAIDAAILIDEV